ncbi:MAG: hypothetical protein ACPGVG_09510 [Mycobacterium sp.]
MTVFAKRSRVTVAAPEPVRTQAEKRDRRRRWLRATYTGDFDLTVEIREILTPLAKEAAKLPCPQVLRPEIDAVADTVHEIVSTVIGMLAESRHLDDGAHTRTARAVRDLAQRPTAPEITDEQIATGKWAAVLVRMTQHQAADFATYLGRALPPGHPRLTGPSASERLVAALRVLDEASLTLHRRIPKAAARQSLPSIEAFNEAKRAQRDADRADAAVSKMSRTKVSTTR